MTMHESWLTWFAVGVQAIILLYFVTLNGLYLALVCLSVVWCWRYKKKAEVHPVNFQALESLERLIPPITAILPAFNEEPVIVQSVRSLLGISYPRVSLVVVNDGS